MAARRDSMNTARRNGGSIYALGTCGREASYVMAGRGANSSSSIKIPPSGWVHTSRDRSRTIMHQISNLCKGATFE